LPISCYAGRRYHKLFLGNEMTEVEFFDELDLDRDGRLSRQELHLAASRLGWRSHEAPIFALLDFLTIRAPLGKKAFISCLSQISRDPAGIYGEVLRQGRWAGELSPLIASCGDNDANGGEVAGESGNLAGKVPGSEKNGTERMVETLVQVLGIEHASAYRAMLQQPDVSNLRVHCDDTALLLIDPQRSFTSGAWMSSLGPMGDLEVMPIQATFDNCADLLRRVYRGVETMFTRCPFPPDSYGWDERFDGIISGDQLYFIKPGNSVLRPVSNGYREWVETLVRSGRKTLVLGGCTLNSCVRVSAVETRNLFAKDDIEVIVDLSLCGARAGNYLPSPVFGGLSPVESAVRQMTDAGVKVAEQVEWSCA